MKKMLFVAAIIITKCFGQSHQFSIVSFGAINDGKTLNTQAVQKGIDSLSALGGGKLIVPKGSFVFGPITLKSNVELHLEKDAFLLGSTSRLDYGKENAVPLITAFHQNNISITGNGTIDGRGKEMVDDLIRLLKQGVLQDEQWLTKRPSERNRPSLMKIADCNNVLIKGITIKNSAGWVQAYERCRKLIIDSIKVESVAYWNNDGIDIVNCHDAVISHCDVNAADDGICLKSEGEPGTCENIVVSDCRIRSSANAFKLGTGSSGGFKNIVASNLTVYDTYRSAIALEAVDGGFLENIDIQHIKATNTGAAIFIRLGHRNKDVVFSTIKNIHIADVDAEIPATKPDKGYPIEGPLLRYPPGMKPAKNGELQSFSPWNNSYKDSLAIVYEHNVFPASITGLPGHLVKNVLLENINITYAGGGSKSVAYFPVDSLQAVTEAENGYPEFSMFGELPAWGLYVRHAEGLMMKNISFKLQKTDYRVATVFDDVNGLDLKAFNISSPNNESGVVLKNVTNQSLLEIKLNAKEIKPVLIKNSAN